MPTVARAGMGEKGGLSTYQVAFGGSQSPRIYIYCFYLYVSPARGDQVEAKLLQERLQVTINMSHLENCKEKQKLLRHVCHVSFTWQT